MKKSITLFIIICTLFLTACTPKVQPFFDDSYQNIDLKSKESFLAYHDGWVYFEDNYYNNPLYRMRLDGTERQEIAFEGPFSWSVFHDGWIYYSSGYFDMDSSPTYKYILCRMQPDGSAQTVLENNVANFILDDGWIYFCHMYNGTTLYRIRLDGTDKQLITDNTSRDSFLIANGYIFFLSGGQNDFGIYRCDLDGKNKTTIVVSNNNAGINLRFASKSHFYYDVISFSQTQHFELHRIDFNGENDRILFSSPRENTVVQTLSTAEPLSDKSPEGYFLDDVLLFDEHAEQGDTIYISYRHYTGKSGTSYSFERILVGENAISAQKVIENPYGGVGSFLALGDILFYRITDNSSVSLYSLSSSKEHSLIYRTGNIKVYSGYFIAENKLVVIARAD